MKLIYIVFVLVTASAYAQTNNFPLYSSGVYGGTQSGDHTGISNAQLKLNATSGYIRIPHLSAHSSVSTVYNFQTGKNAYWGEPGDAGAYFFRGRHLFVSDGNLGVGTTSPGGKLDVNAGSSYAIRTSTSNRYVIEVKNSSDVGGGWWLANDPNGSFAIHENGVGDKLTINAGGNVGIGTTTPDSKLTVKGNIHSQEVKVDLAGAVAPDYVFKKGYALTSLEELKNYIDQNKHLPEVPSAREMEEEGINLKEMNLILLKKVEELTLYQIESAEKITLLENEIIKLKRK